MFEAYKVGVTVALTNHVSRGLLLMQRDLAKTDAQVTKLKASLHAMQTLAFKGAAAGGAGYLGLKAVGALVKPAEEYVHQLELARSKLANLAPAKAQLEIAQMTAAAWATSAKVMTSTPTQNLKAVQELRMVLGGTATAARFLPQMMKIQAVLDSALSGEHGVAAKDVAFTAAKALEIRGASGDPKAFEQQADLIVKAVIASGGRFNPAMLLQAQKYAGIGGAGYSNDFLYGVLPTLTQELGGASTGTALTSLYRAVVGGRIDKKALGVWQKLGLLDGVQGVTGETAMVRAKNAALYQQNPLEYMQYLSGQLAERGVTTPAQQQQAFEQLFSNRVAGRIGNILATQGPRLQKDFALINQAGTSAEYDRLVKSDPVMARMAAGAQWDALKTVLGLEVVPLLLPAIKGLADGLKALTAWARDNPAAVKALVLGLTALSGALLFSGTVLLLKAAFVGLGGALGVNGVLGVLGAGTGAGLTAAVSGLGTALGLLAPGVLAILGAVRYHAAVAGGVDARLPGVGDGLLKLRDAWNDPATGAAATFAPPAKSTTVVANINMDGRPIAQHVIRQVEKDANRPAGATGRFDPGAGFAPTGATGAW